MTRRLLLLLFAAFALFLMGCGDDGGEVSSGENTEEDGGDSGSDDDDGGDEDDESGDDESGDDDDGSDGDDESGDDEMPSGMDPITEEDLGVVGLSASDLEEEGVDMNDIQTFEDLIEFFPELEDELEQAQLDWEQALADLEEGLQDLDTGLEDLDAFLGGDCLEFSLAYIGIFLGGSFAALGGEEAIAQIEDEIEALSDSVPPEIAEEFAIVTAAFSEFFAELGEAGLFGGEDIADPLEDPEVEAAMDAIDAYLEEECSFE